MLFDDAGQMPLHDLDLGKIDNSASGFILRDRADLSGHGNKAPHLNSDLINPAGTPLRFSRDAAGDAQDFRDISQNQFPGMNQL